VNLRSGAGAAISTSLLNAGLYLLSELLQRPDGQFSELPQLNQQQTGFHPAERLYAVGNRWLAIAARSDSMAARLVGALDLTDRIRIPRADWGENEASLIAQAVIGQDFDSLLVRLKTADVWAAACRFDAKETTLSDPAMRTGSAVLSANDSRYGSFNQIGTQFTLSRSPTVGRGDSPAIGEHSRQVLTELGYGPAEIERLYRDKVVA
jgi:crotonobetainyl-CoA:carnitine CoA-transferase CaiB-like acyl-CoA transferase